VWVKHTWLLALGIKACRAKYRVLFSDANALIEELYTSTIDNTISEKLESLSRLDLLIIDEPEAHLHPQWIVEYARILVLLNKKLGVKFMIASHNPDMVSALRYISEKEEILQNVHFLPC